MNDSATEEKSHDPGSLVLDREAASHMKNAIPGEAA
jgi:hypothetical protein